MSCTASIGRPSRGQATRTTHSVSPSDQARYGGITSTAVSVKVCVPLSEVTIDEAAKWNYHVNEELYIKLLDVLEYGINRRRYSEHKVAALGRDLRQLARNRSESWAVPIQVLAREIERRIRVYGDRLLQQEVRRVSSGSSDGQHKLATATDGEVQGLSVNLPSEGGSTQTNSGVAQEAPRLLDLFSNPIESNGKVNGKQETKENGLQRTDGLRTEGLSTDGIQPEKRTSGEQGEAGEGVAQEGGGTQRVRGGGSNGANRSLQPGLQRLEEEQPKRNVNNNHAERGKDYAPKSVEENHGKTLQVSAYGLRIRHLFGFASC